MTESSSDAPPKVWKWESQNGGAFTATNRPIAGPTHGKDVTVGQHPLQIYSRGTPNGEKVTVNPAVFHDVARYPRFASSQRVLTPPLR
jgi:GST-like protein